MHIGYLIMKTKLDLIESEVTNDPNWTCRPLVGSHGDIENHIITQKACDRYFPDGRYSIGHEAMITVYVKE